MDDDNNDLSHSRAFSDAIREWVQQYQAEAAGGEGVASDIDEIDISNNNNNTHHGHDTLNDEGRRSSRRHNGRDSSNRAADERRRNRRMWRGRRMRYAAPQPTEPIPPEESTITVILDDGTVVQREMTDAERFLHSHLNRVRDNYIEHNLQSEITTAIETGQRREDPTEDYVQDDNRRKLFANLVLLVTMIIVCFMLALDEQDNSDSIPMGSRIRDSFLRGEQAKDWTDTIDGVSVYYRGYIQTDEPNYNDATEVHLELDSRGSKLPNLRLLAMDIGFDPPLVIGKNEANTSGKHSVDSMEFQGWHMVESNRFFLTGKGVRGGLYVDDSGLTPDDSYSLYYEACNNNFSVRSSYFSTLYNTQLEEYPELLQGVVAQKEELMMECELNVNGHFSRDWDKVVVATPHFSRTTGAGRGMPFPEGGNSFERFRPLGESITSNQLRWRRLDEIDEIVVPDSNNPHMLMVDFSSATCPELNFSIQLEALNVQKTGSLLLSICGGLFALIIIHAVTLQKWIGDMVDEEIVTAQLLKIEIRSLIMHVLLGGFESGLLFSFGLESALYVPVFVVLAVTHAFTTILLMVRFTVIAWKTQLARRIETMRSLGEMSQNELTTAMREEASAFVRLLTVACAGGLLLAARIFMYIPEAFALIYFVVWLPQIYSDMKEGTHRSLPLSVLIPVTLVRCAFPYLIWAMPEMNQPLTEQNWWRSPFDGLLLPQVPRAPNPIWAMLSIGALILQVAILGIGHCLGPRWWVPFILLPELHDFSKPPKIIEYEDGVDVSSTNQSVGIGRKSIGRSLLKSWFGVRTFLMGVSNDETNNGLEMKKNREGSNDDNVAIEISPDDDHEEFVEEAEISDGVYRQECVICMTDVEVPISLCRDKEVNHETLNYDWWITILPLFLYQRIIKRIKCQREEELTPNINLNEIIPWALTPCEHLFHESCLREWCDVKRECPTCRMELPNFIN